MEDLPRYTKCSRSRTCIRNSSKSRILFMSMYIDIDWDQKHSEDVCKQIRPAWHPVANYFRKDDQLSPDRATKKKKYRGFSYKLDGEWNATAEDMMKTFAENGHPVFKCSSPLSKGVLKSKSGGRASMHNNADPSTTDDRRQ